MVTVVDADVHTRRGDTVHEDIGDKVSRVSGDIWQEYAYIRQTEVDKETLLKRFFLAPEKKTDEDFIATICGTLVEWEPHSWATDWSAFRDVLVETPAKTYEFELLHNYLQDLFLSMPNERRDVVVTVVTRATNDTSTFVRWFHASYQEAENPLDRFPKTAHVTDWTNEKNHKRCELVDKEIAGTLSAEERVELEKLQAEMLAYRRKVAPLPLSDLRSLHQALLQRSSDHATGSE